MRLLTEPQIECFIRHRHATMLGGLVIMALAIAFPRGWGFGLFSGFMLFSLGGYSATFRKWRTDPGLWMLAVLLVLTLGPCWAYFEFLFWRGLFTAPPGKQGARPITWEQLRLSIDCIIAMLLFAMTVKLCAAVAMENWNRT